MKQYTLLLCLSGICVAFLFCGCTEESSTIEITIESFSPYEAHGFLTVDSIRIQNFSLSMFNSTTIIVEKTLLPEQTYHNVTASLEPLDVDDVASTASCAKATTQVSFTVNVQHQINKRSCQ